MNTLLGRMWIAGAAVGLLLGIYLFMEREGGIGGIFGAVFLGSMAGILIALAVGSIRSRRTAPPR